MVMRTYGLSGSGMDVDQMVKDLMKAQRVKYDGMVQKKTQAEWKKADYNTMYTAVKDFRNTVFNYKLSSTLSPRQASSTDETKATATATADAASISHSLTITQLAEGVKLSSSGAITTSTADDAKTTLAKQMYGGAAATTFNLTISDGTTTKAIIVDTSKSIYEFVSDINNSGLSVKANYDSTLDRFFFSSSKSGEASQISFSAADADGKTTGAAGIDFLENKLKVSSATQHGKDAKFSLDGVSLSQSSNNFTISGVTYNLKAVGTTTVGVTADNDKVIANVKAFIESYNTAIGKLNGELKEDKYKDFLPLTDEQKSAMSESEIKAWEEKARSGMLRRDSTLQEAVNAMRNNIASPVSGVQGKYNSLSAIGITSGDYTENGKLYLDETKLKKALEQDPEIVNKLFSATGDTSSKQGIAVRLYDTLKTTMDKIGVTAGYSAGISDDTESTLAKQIRAYNKQISAFSTRLVDIENSYYKKFTAMETALSKLTQQSSWLSQQLGNS